MFASLTAEVINPLRGDHTERGRGFAPAADLKPRPGPGSVVNVPFVRPEDRMDIRGLITDITQIVTAAVTLGIVALRP